VRDVIFGILLAAAASSCFNFGLVIQAGEARKEKGNGGLSPKLLLKLVRRPTWLGGTALQIGGGALQVLALTLAPLAVVQPADSFGLIVLLIFGARKLGDHVGRRELLGVGAIIVGVLGVALTAPEHSSSSAATATLFFVLAPLALLAVIPYAFGKRVGGTVIVLAAGLTFALGAFMLKLLADSVTASAWLAVAAVLVAVGLLGALGMTSEQNALQRRTVGHVAPIIFVMEMIIPIVLGLLIGGEDWPQSPALIVIFIASLFVTAAAAVSLILSPAAMAIEQAAKEQPASKTRSRLP